ncbi:MAG: hypothetical protein DCC50_13035 [Acidobacteria bacterium]|nr:MAG: hypothetical protein DCC50_13035 [Acidobacteriota bacterium]
MWGVVAGPEEGHEEGQEREAGLDPVVAGLREVGVRRCTDDADLVEAVREVVERVEEVERQRRAERGGPVGRGSRALSRTVRLTAMGDIEVALGFSAWEAGLLITAATAEEALARMVDGALRSGEATWVLVRLFYEKTASLEDEQRLLVAAALFGDDPELAAADRLDPEDQLHGAPWSVPRYKAALDAEVAACRSVDVEAERAARARAYAARRARVRVHDDGTATLSIRGSVASVLGASQRLDRAAKGVHALGDPRLMDQLRADLGLGLLSYGTVALGGGQDKPAGPAPQAGDTADGWGATVDDTDVKDGTNAPPQEPPPPTGDTDGAQDTTGDTDGAQGVLFDPVLAPDDMELLARVVNALSAVALQVIVPYAALAGGFPICGHCSGTLERRSSRGGPGPSGAPGPGRDEPPAEDPGEDSARRGPPGRACRGRGRGRGRVGEVLGPHPLFVTDGHARELALMPGTTLHRLVVDPRDGRLVERTTQGLPAGRGHAPAGGRRRRLLAGAGRSRAGHRGRAGPRHPVRPGPAGRRARRTSHCWPSARTSTRPTGPGTWRSVPGGT